jgi:spore germination protein GerM
MRVELTLKLTEIDQDLIALIKTLLSKNAEVVIKREAVALAEYDAGQSLEQVMQELAGANHSTELLADIEHGLKLSSVYASDN